MAETIKQYEEGNTLRIELPQEMDKEFATELDVLVKQWLLQSSDFFALDFKNVKIMKQACYHSLLVFTQHAKSAEKKIVSLNVSPQLENQIKNDGIAAALNAVADLKTYINNQTTKAKPMQLDVKLINPFLTATQNTFEKQANVKCEPQKPSLVTVDSKTYESSVALAGIISLATDNFKGSITLVFGEKVFLGIYESMFGEKHEKINGEMQDAAGELLNIIYGTAKTVLNQEHGYQLKPVIPTVLSGEKLNVRQQTKQKIIVLPFKTQHGEFQVEISFEATA